MPEEKREEMFPIKKKVLAMVLAVATMLGLFVVPASAAGNGPDVRVNGYLVEFPDAQPYIDGNNRTLIPVRFVTEAMGADVSWNGATRTAVIEKDGTKVEITIGQKDIKSTPAPTKLLVSSVTF